MRLRAAGWGRRRGSGAGFAGVACLIVMASAAGLLGCLDADRQAPEREVAIDGDPDRGERLISEYGCGACHTVPGVGGARGTVAPPLNFFARRSYIAGRLTNTAPALIGWIMSPDSIEPGTAMPDLDVSERDARDITAYLYTLY